jgi:hypothetical protein
MLHPQDEARCLSARDETVEFLSLQKPCSLTTGVIHQKFYDDRSWCVLQLFPPFFKQSTSLLHE